MRRSLYTSLQGKFGTRLSIAERGARLRDKQAHLARNQLKAQRGFQKLASGQKKRKTHVVVIGAGFAGLYAAAELLHNPVYAGRFEVTVLEATTRVGGRVRTDGSLAPGRLVEAGAELIGINHALWVHLCREFDLGFVWLSPEEQGVVGLESPLFLNGQRLTEPVQSQLFEELTGLYKRMSNEARAVADPYAPWRTGNAEAMDGKSAFEWILEQASSELAAIALTSVLENNNASVVACQSWLGNLSLVAGAALGGRPDDYWRHTENARCDSGNEALASALAARIGADGGHLMLDAPATMVSVDADRVLVTARGNALPAEFVVLAVPPSAWEAITFEHVDVSSGGMNMGDAVKYLSVVSNRFWLRTSQTPNSSNNRIGQTWEATENHMVLPNGEFVFSLFAGARSARNARGDTDRLRRSLSRMYPGFAESFKRGILVDWQAEDRIGSGYSCPAPGQVTTVGRFLSTAPSGRLVFAGEHTCMAFFGYMEGALQSGRIAAERVGRLAYSATAFARAASSRYDRRGAT